MALTASSVPTGAPREPDASRDSVPTPLGTAAVDPTEPLDLLVRDLRSDTAGLSSAEALRRLTRWGPNELTRRGGRRWPRELLRQVVHPLALLLWGAALLAWVAGIIAVAIAIVVVIAINALFAFIQELEAERAVETLASFLPSRATVFRDGVRRVVEAREIVPGDLIALAEGDRVPADARLVDGALEVDMSMLTGESVAVTRTAGEVGRGVGRLQATDLVFSGTSATEGEALGLVFATAMNTEIGRIAALSERVGVEESPLDVQVRSVAKLIAVIAVVMGIAFIPIATLGAGLSLRSGVVFAIGLLVGNVPEGLLPVITLALAVGVRGLVRRGAVVKRLSAVETLGCTSVICTDKTGTLTENRMRAARLWVAGEAIDFAGAAPATANTAQTAMADAIAACSNARLGDGEPAGDPTEVAMLAVAGALGADTDPRARERARRAHFHFDPVRKLMSTVDEAGGALWVNTKGAPESVLPQCTTELGADGTQRPLDQARRDAIATLVDGYAGEGLRVLAVARRALEGSAVPGDREAAEHDLCFGGLVAMIDPPRPEVADAVANCHGAGIRIHVVTGDHGLTAAAIARRAGIGGEQPLVVPGDVVDAMRDADLAALLGRDREVIFSRSSPEEKLRIADALRTHGEVVAMTGDGVNDAPALRAADIGVAMGRSGTDVAREAATMVLTDDNFATIVAATEAGRRVYDNIRKFIVYIFAHTTPEVVPFLVFALGGGAIPLPLTVMQLLAFDVGTETVPALALGREPAEPGLMRRPPRGRDENVIKTSMLLRAWLFLGVIAAALGMTGFFYVLLSAGWQPGDPTGSGTPLHHVYLQATTMTFLGMVAAQVGTAFAARTERASLRSVGVLSNRLLLWGIAFELALAAALIYVPVCQSVLGTAALPARYVLFCLPYPFIVWGADELRRWYMRRREPGSAGRRPTPAGATA